MLRNGDSALTKARGVFSAFTPLPGGASPSPRGPGSLPTASSSCLSVRLFCTAREGYSLLAARSAVMRRRRAWGVDSVAEGVFRRTLPVDDEKPRSPRIACPSRPSPDWRKRFSVLRAAVLSSDEAFFGHEALPRLRALFLTGDVLPKACRPSCCASRFISARFPRLPSAPAAGAPSVRCGASSVFPLPETPSCCALPGSALLPSSQARNAFPLVSPAAARSLRADAGAARSSRQARAFRRRGLFSRCGTRLPFRQACPLGIASSPEFPQLSSQPLPEVFPCLRQRLRVAATVRASWSGRGEPASACRRSVLLRGCAWFRLRARRKAVAAREAAFGAPGAENALLAPEFSAAERVFQALVRLFL